MRIRLSVVVALGMAGYALPAQAATIVQITANTQVTQDIVTQAGDPNYFDPGLGPSDPDAYIFFDEHIRILTEEANVWDPSQIPTAPNSALAGTPHNVISTGTLTGTWTFDADILAQDLRGKPGSINPDGSLSGTLLGFQDSVSTFSIVSMGVEVVSAAATTSQIYVADDLVVSASGQQLDVIGILADNDDWTESTSGGVLLLLAGDSNWFEDAASAGTAPDLGRIVDGKVEYEEASTGVTSEGATVSLYNELIEGGLAGSDVSVRVFGAADGSSETSPLLPDSVAMAPDGTPTFGFDVGVTGTDIVYIDPEIAVGYTYEIEGGGEFSKIAAPSTDTVADTDGYTVSMTLPTGEVVSFTLMPGEEKELPTGITRLVLTGIDPSLMLDPLDNSTFVTGFLLAGSTESTSLTQTPLVVDSESLSSIPLPPGALLMLSGLGLFGFVARRRRTA